MQTPLPKPTAPQAAATPPQGPTVATQQAPAQPPVVAPASQTPVVTPSASPMPTPTPPSPRPPQPPTAPTSTPAVATVSPSPVQPVAVPSTGQAMPPKTLSALSSMNSTQIPQNTVAGLPSQVPAQPATPSPGIAATVPPLPVPKALSGPGSLPPVGTTPQAQLPGAPAAPGAKPSVSPTATVPTPGASAPAAGAADAGSGSSKPKFASVDTPWSKYGVIAAIVLVVLGLIGGAAYYFLGGASSTTVSQTDSPNGGSVPTRQVVSGEEVALEYWGLWEPTEVMEQVISEFEAENPGVTVTYSKQSHLNYRERLQTAISTGSGPDVFRFHASWTPMLVAELKPIPASVMTAAEFKSTYYPVASEQLQVNGQYVGVPMMYDGLALLYNKEMLTTAGIQPPTTWAEVKEAAVKLTIKGSNGTISRGGIALGNASNVDHFSDILGLLMLQNGADLAVADSQEVADALNFYTSFQLTDNVWSPDLPNSTAAFAREEVAMIIAPSWRVHEILAQNPDLSFGVSTVPVIEEKLGWGTFWAEGMNAKGKNQEAAAKFLAFLTKKETLETFFDAASKTRAFGELYPRIDMASQLSENEYAAAYIEDAPYAKGWYLSSLTHDNGLNDQMSKYYEDAVSAMVLDGKKANVVQATLQQGVAQVLRQYGVTKSL